MKPEPDTVARCVALDGQYATSEADRATGSATSAQPVSLKSLANKVLERNKLRNERATRGEKPSNFQEPKALRGAPPRERNAQPASDPAAEARRSRVLAMLAERPGIRYAVLTDVESDPEAVLLTLAIRGRATCEFRIPRDRYDPFLLLDLIERHSGTVH